MPMPTFQRVLSSEETHQVPPPPTVPRAASAEPISCDQAQPSLSRAQTADASSCSARSHRGHEAQGHANFSIACPAGPSVSKNHPGQGCLPAPVSSTTSNPSAQRSNTAGDTQPLSRTGIASGSACAFVPPCNQPDITLGSWKDAGDIVAERSTLSWVNVLLGWIWPKANTALSNYVHEDLTARLQESLPGPFKGAHFSRFTLGQQTPEFGPIEVIRHSETHVEVDLEMRYVSDVDICFDAGTGGISLGINQLIVAGKLCMVLYPLVGKFPLIGCTQLFFAALPQITLKFTGLASVAHYVGVEEVVQKTVDNWMRARMVLPNRGVWPNFHSEDDLDMLDACSLRPLGVLRIRVLRGRNLAGVNWMALGTERFTSHPYCMLRLGAEEARSSTVHGSTDPEWPDTDPSVFFTVYHRDQCLEVSVFGEDQSGVFGKSNFVSFLGKIPVGHTVWRIATEWPEVAPQDGRRRHSVILDTRWVKKEMLHVDDPVNVGIPSELEIEAHWYDIFDSPQRDHVGSNGDLAETKALLQVEIHKGVGFPIEYVQERGSKGIRWRIRIAALRETASSGSTSSTSRRGEVCDVEEAEFPDLPIHPRLFAVIDKLVERSFSLRDIARICGVDSEDIIALYLQHKADHLERHKELERLRKQGENRVNLQWYEALHCCIQRVVGESVCFTLELLNGHDKVVGVLGPFQLQPAADGCCVLARDTHSIRPPQRKDASVGLFGGFFRSNDRALAGIERWAAVELQVSARLRGLAPAGMCGGSVPRSAAQAVFSAMSNASKKSETASE